MCAKEMGPDGVRFDDQGKICSIDRDSNSGWERAVYVCPSGALKPWGEYMDEDQVFEIVKRDLRYYETSGGGVTVSGGEPLCQAKFAEAVLRRCRQARIGTCLETTLKASWDIVEPLVRQADVVIADLKCVNSAKHARFTGVPNELILANLVRCAQEVDKLVVRIPVIPGFNDTPEDALAFANWLEANMKGLVDEVQLLEFMHLGEEKCRSIEKRYPMEGRTIDREKLHETVLALQQTIGQRGINCVLGAAAKTGAKKQ